MRESLKTGIGFGGTSGVITPLGLLVGLDSSTGSKLAIIGGILTVAIADSFSDALGIHNSEESKKRNGKRAVWEATITTFFAKFFIAISFIVPFLFADISTAVLISILWGFILLSILNYKISKRKKENSLKFILSHLFIAVLVVALSYIAGKLIGYYFS